MTPVSLVSPEASMRNLYFLKSGVKAYFRKAAQNGHEKVARLLLSTSRAEAIRRDKIFHERAVDWALESGNNALIDLLLAYPSLDVSDEDGRRTLSYEATYGNVDLANGLLRIGANPNTK
ncbi:hypothetical protein CC80DRAFT_501721 [Byssothecium circinans]|uniref:Uncharacterized protein n=1 Tax=Byssothecium circinans TaxID=147558 RepID=A0A6A5U487_9PLEO|nr:hypothetical protein CC80DRAFT_501721 [Byssothecium circinans]